MLRVLLTLLPAFLPIILYLVWYYKNFKKLDVKIYDENLEKIRTFRFYAILISCLIAIIILAYLGLSQDKMPAPI